MPTSPPAQTEAQFLAQYDANHFPAVSLAVDIVVLQARADALHVLLVRRTEHPFKDRYALPGAFVRPRETTYEASQRALGAKAGVPRLWLEQLATFDDPDRDPRTRVISVAHLALSAPDAVQPARQHAVWARVDVPWSGETGGPVHALVDGAPAPLAFDHGDILGAAIQRIRGKLAYSNIGFALLPPQFTLNELRHVHQLVLGRSLNKDAFRRKMLASGLIQATGESQAGVGHRPAAFYAHTGIVDPHKGRK